MKTRIRAMICALWILTTASYARAASIFTLLGFVTGDNYSAAYGVSSDGSVVVGVSGFQPYEGAGSYRAFRWTAASGMVGLGHLPGGSYSQAYAVSGDGLVVVGSSDRSWLSPSEAFRWTAASGMIGLGYLSGSTNSVAKGVSGNGSVVVGFSGWHPYEGAGSYQAFRWTAGSGIVGMGFLPGGTNSSANGVSADGSVIVGTCYSASGSQAFRWTAASGMTGLGYLPGGTNSSANAVSADGSIIVGTSSSASGNQAFRWTAGFGMQQGGNGVSVDTNTIIGSFEQDDGRPEAFLEIILAASPALSINHSSSGHCVVSWLTNYTGFTLQASTAYGSTNWTNCTSPSVSDGYFVVTNPMSSGAQFFRLKK